ncbi:S8 family serine peptidase [Myxococcus sp. K15C18031901]|nr:S8 family serine peptidase [Myxococcus dinghuensis]
MAVLDNGVASVGGLPATRVEHFRPDGTPWANPPFGQAHGTYCAGLIASSHARSPGLAPGATVLNFPIVGPDGRPSLDAVEEALAVGCFAASAQVVSCSFLLDAVTPRLQHAVQLLSQAGVFVVGAAGNTPDTTAAFPEQVQGIFTATALGSTGRVLPTASLDDWVDVAAPGEALRVVQPDGRWTTWNGLTSGAAAITAGAAALALGLCDTQDELRKMGQALPGLIRSTSSQISPEMPFGRLAPLPLVKAALALLGALSS